jgi:3-oxoacyl-[acyl-carrier protein] reductase
VRRAGFRGSGADDGRATLPRLRAGGSSIVSIIGGTALRGDPERFHVSAAKYGLVGMTKACAVDPINVNAVSPSHMETRRRRRHRGLPGVAGGRDVTGHLIEVGAAR